MEPTLQEAYLLLAHYDAEKGQLVQPRLLEMSLNGVVMAELALRGRVRAMATREQLLMTE